MQKIVVSLLLVSFAWLVSLSAQAGPTQSDPVALLQYSADNMISQLKANKATLKSKPEIVYSLARRYVVPYANITEMSRRVIPPAVWNSATPAQRSQFQSRFTTTLIRTYASALSAYEDQSVKFYPVRGGYQGKSTVTVESDIISSENSPIHVTYRMVRVGSVWRLIDLSVEGVDMLDSFRAQYADILASGSMDELLKRMSNHNTRDSK
jgi:phospholipid transport system substrate-binding protein